MSHSKQINAQPEPASYSVKEQYSKMPQQGTVQYRRLRITSHNCAADYKSADFRLLVWVDGQWLALVGLHWSWKQAPIKNADNMLSTTLTRLKVIKARFYLLLPVFDFKLKLCASKTPPLVGEFSAASK